MIRDSKLFGKINVIDFCIVLGLIGALVIVFTQFRGGGSPIAIPILAADESREFTMSFFAPEIEDFRLGGISIGDPLFEGGSNIFLGYVISLDIDEAVIWNADRYGNTVRSNKEGHSSLEITTRLRATPAEHGVIVGGNRYGIGHSLTVRVGRSVIFMRISGLEEAGA